MLSLDLHFTMALVESMPKVRPLRFWDVPSLPNMPKTAVDCSETLRLLDTEPDTAKRDAFVLELRTKHDEYPTRSTGKRHPLVCPANWRWNDLYYDDCDVYDIMHKDTRTSWCVDSPRVPLACFWYIPSTAHFQRCPLGSSCNMQSQRSEGLKLLLEA